ncbi:MAG TPA: hypothetical protein VFE36_02430 [Candidatus Baltobacteraceae bacterium]|jgi:hypothetical protein|nr:hypothetical protein [Candidatus Baltobacteraceae bacterium]
MDPRVALLKEFSRGFVRHKAKIESEEFGFAYLEQLLSDGSTLEYGHLADTRVLHKYKIVNITDCRMDELLQMHVMKECNVCRYFGADKNDVLCFNMDNNHRTNNTAITPEMSLALDALRECLLGLGCEPLIVTSGRGYHVWLRLDEPVENKVLFNFMVQAAARALLPLVIGGNDHRTIRFRFYPNIEVSALSLRLFGSEHANNKVFSRVLTPNVLLDEADSWKYFEHFVRNKITPTATFRSALDELEAGLSAVSRGSKT